MVNPIPSRYNSRINLNLSQDPLIDQTENPILYEELSNLHTAIEALTQGDSTADADLLQSIAKLQIDNSKLRSIVSKLAGNSLNYGVFVGNTRVITQLSDFENYTDTTVTLADKIEYFIAGLVDISPRRLVAAGKTMVRGAGLNRSILTSDIDGGYFFTAPDSVYMNDVTINASGTASCVDFSSTAAALITLSNSTLTGESPGRIIGFAGTSVIIRFCGADPDQSPMEFGGSFVRIDFDEFFPESVSVPANDTFVQFLSGIVVTDRINCTKALMTLDTGSVGFDFLDITNLPNEGVQFQDNTFFNPTAGDPVLGLDRADNEAFFSDNVGLGNSFPNCGLQIENNALLTDMAGFPTPSLINTDNATDATFTQRFVLTGTRYEYTGAQSRAFNVTATLVMETGQSNQRIGAQVFVNAVGSQVAFSTVTSGAAGSRVENMSLSGSIGLDPGDIVDLRIFNVTSADDILASDVVFQLAALG